MIFFYQFLVETSLCVVKTFPDLSLVLNLRNKYDVQKHTSSKVFLYFD